jgi:hypothetical protein
MSFEDKEAELGLLFTRIRMSPLIEMRLKLNELKAFGIAASSDRRARIDRVISERARR